MSPRAARMLHIGSLFLILMFLSIPVFAGETIVLDDGADSVRIGGMTDVFIDSGSTMTFADVTNSGVAWQACENENINFGYSPSTVWLRFTVNDLSSGGQHWLLAVDYMLDFVELYLPTANGSYAVKKSGSIFPIALRDIKHRTSLFRLDPGSGAPKTYYLKIASNTSLNIPLTLWNREAFYAFDHEESLISGMFFGLVLIMIVYNLFFFIFLNDVTYLYFVLSVSGYFLYLLGLKGFDYEYLFPNNPFPFRQISPVVGAFAMFWTVRFEQSFLKTKQTVPFFHTVLNVVLGIEAALFAGAILIRHNIFGIAGNIITIVWIAAIIGAAIAAWARKSRDAPFVLFAHTTTFLGVLLFSLKSLGILPANAITQYSHQIGFSISVVLLSIGMASSIIRIRLEKEKAQSESLEYLKKAGELQDKFVDYLETRVEERTQALNDAYDKLKHKESAISRDIHLAKRIQSSLLPKDLACFDPDDCVVKYLPMIEVGGDLYDMFRMDGGIVRVFLADATGHGVQAALLTMLIKSQYESVKQFYSNPHEVFYHMNESFISNYSHLDFFFTGIILDIDAKKSLIRYASAGHPAQILAGRKGITEIPPSGKLIGIVPNVKFQTLEISYAKGDKLLLFTDGLFEEFNAQGEELGYSKFRQWIESEPAPDLKTFVDNLLSRSLAFIGDIERNDDITFIGLNLKN